MGMYIGDDDEFVLIKWFDLITESLGRLGKYGDWVCEGIFDVKIIFYLLEIQSFHSQGVLDKIPTSWYLKYFWEISLILQNWLSPLKLIAPTFLIEREREKPDLQKNCRFSKNNFKGIVSNSSTKACEFNCERIWKIILCLSASKVEKRCSGHAEMYNMGHAYTHARRLSNSRCFLNAALINH